MHAVAAETKIGLLMGLSLVLVLGVLVSDLLTHAEPDAIAGDTGPLTRLGVGVQESLGGYVQPAVPERPHAEADPDVVTVRRGERGAWEAPVAALVAKVTATEPLRAVDGVTMPPLLLKHEAAAEAVEAMPEATRQGGVGGVSVVRHVVQADETLTGIARRYYNDGTKWRLLADANPRIGPSGNVRQGMTLTIPDPADPADPTDPTDPNHGCSTPSLLPSTRITTDRTDEN